ncbi:MAG: helix-turn-helix domain-containing protein [Sphingobium sp.]
MARISGKVDEQGALRQLGAAIRAARKGKGCSQEALADLAEIDRSHMGKIERGERNVSILNLIRVANALNRKPGDLLNQAGL